MGPQDNQDVIESAAKLQSHGHVDFVKNLSPVQHMLTTNPVQNFIPRRVVGMVILWVHHSILCLTHHNQLHQVQNGNFPKCAI